MIEHLASRLADYSAQGVCVALSGGCDSTVLLHMLVKLRESGRLNQPLRAIHINHQLQAQAAQWSRHCEANCQQWQVPLTIKEVQVQSQGEGLEAAARTARYEVFDQALQTGEGLLLAHHADDQAETLLFRLLRGSGAKGLAAMAETRALGAGALYRPLLSVTSQQIEEYAHRHNLQWVEDPSNQDDTFDRNFLRNRLLPLIETRWPSAKKNIAKAAQLLQQSNSIVSDVIAKEFKALNYLKARLGSAVDVKVLRAYSISYQAELIRYWCQQERLPAPDFTQFEKVFEQLEKGQDSSWKGALLKHFNGRLYLLPDRQAKEFVSCDLTLGQLLLNSESSLEVLEHQGSGLKPGSYRVLMRQGGERCKPAGRARSQTLKRLLQEYELEPWLRSEVPLIYSGDTIAAVGDLWVCEGFVQHNGYRVIWCLSHRDNLQYKDSNK